MSLNGSKVILRPARPDDAQVCGRICYEAFKNIAETHGFAPDFPSPEVASGLLEALFAQPQVYSVVADRDGQVVGSNFLHVCGPVGAIGPITVDPSRQNHGIGRQLMQDVMAHGFSRGLPSLRLVQAAYHNRSLSLYTRLGFNVQEPLSTLQGPALNLTIPGYTVRPATMADLPACADLCVQVHGFERSLELGAAATRGTATVVEHDGHITGYAAMVGYFGHAVGRTSEELKALIGAAPEFPGPGFLLPSRCGELFRWCLNHGLRVVQPTTLMSAGLYNEPTGAFLPSILF